jgi:hypothetical protein
MSSCSVRTEKFDNQNSFQNVDYYGKDKVEVIEYNKQGMSPCQKCMSDCSKRGAPSDVCATACMYGKDPLHPGPCAPKGNYEQIQTVCANQDVFNHAFRHAVKYTNKKNKPSNGIMIASGILMLIFIVWALILASRIPTGPQKAVHFVLALLFSPIYVIAYYFGGNQ